MSAAVICGQVMQHKFLHNTCLCRISCDLNMEQTKEFKPFSGIHSNFVVRLTKKINGHGHIGELDKDFVQINPQNYFLELIRKTSFRRGHSFFARSKWVVLRRAAFLPLGAQDIALAPPTSQPINSKHKRITLFQATFTKYRKCFDYSFLGPQ